MKVVLSLICALALMFAGCSEPNGGGGQTEPSGENGSWSITNFRDDSNLDDIIRILEMQEIEPIDERVRAFANNDDLKLLYVATLFTEGRDKNVTFGDITETDTAGLDWRIDEYFGIEISLDRWLANNERNIKQRYVLAFMLESELYEDPVEVALPETREEFIDWYASFGNSVCFVLLNLYGKVGEFAVGLTMTNEVQYDVIIPISPEYVNNSLLNDAKEIMVLNDAQFVADILYAENTRIVRLKEQWIEKNFVLVDVIESIVGEGGNIVTNLDFGRETSRQMAEVTHLTISYVYEDTWMTKYYSRPQ